MKNHELFDLIGEVNEDYVLSADKTAKRARPRWRTWAACAACAALILGGAYPASQALSPQQPPLHGYTVLEGNGGYWSQQADIKAPYQGSGAENVPDDGEPPAPNPTDPPRGSGPDAGPDMDGNQYSGDAPVDQAPYDQYNSLFENAHLDEYPEWYGGAYIDYTDSGEPSKLVVCIVDGFHTPELEQQIAEWCGEGVWTYRDVKYSRGYLQELMERLNGGEFLSVLEADKAVSGWGVYEDGNCVQMDCRDIPTDATLAALARLDPDGDAIQVRVKAGQTVNTDIVKGPAPGGAQEDQPPAEPEEPSETPPNGAETAIPAHYDTLPGVVSSSTAPVPGGTQSADDPIAVEPEGEQPARYDTLPAELPLGK